MTAEGKQVYVHPNRTLSLVTKMAGLNVRQQRGAQGTRWCSWLRHCARRRKVMVSIPFAVIGICHWLNPSGHTIALGSAQLLTEMSKGGRCLGLTTLPPSFTDCLKILGTSTFWSLKALAVCNGITLPLLPLFMTARPQAKETDVFPWFISCYACLFTFLYVFFSTIVYSRYVQLQINCASSLRTWSLSQMNKHTKIIPRVSLGNVVKYVV